MDKTEFALRATEVKQRYNILSYVSSLLGPGKKTNRSYMFHCPFHDDENPSFSVNEETGTCSCFGTCNFRGMDIIGFLARYRFNGNLSKALIELEKNVAPIINHKVYKKHIPTTKDIDRMASAYTSMINQLLPNVERSIPYFRSRGIHPDTLEWRRLTLDDRFYYTRPTYNLKDGRKITLPISRYVAPRIKFGKVYGVNSRRNDLHAMAVIDADVNNLVSMIKDDMEERTGSYPTNEKLMDKLFPRYLKWTYSGIYHEGLYNVHQLLWLDDNGKPYQPELGYCIKCESEFAANTLEDFGYRAVGGKSLLNLHQAFKNVNTLFVSQDNDSEKIDLRSGGKQKAGENIARETLQAANHPNGKLLIHPDKCKGLDDYLIRFPDEAQNYLERQYGILPVPREQLNNHVRKYAIAT